VKTLTVSVHGVYDDIFEGLRDEIERLLDNHVAEGEAKSYLLTVDAWPKRIRLDPGDVVVCPIHDRLYEDNGPMWWCPGLENRASHYENIDFSIEEGDSDYGSVQEAPNVKVRQATEAELEECA
jgi:hypothetical protein